MLLPVPHAYMPGSGAIAIPGALRGPIVHDDSDLDESFREEDVLAAGAHSRTHARTHALTHTRTHARTHARSTAARRAIGGSKADK